MEQYESWMKTWNKWKHEWIHSDDHISCFVLNAIPPNRRYSTNTHHLLSLTIGDACDCVTSIRYREKTINVPDGSSMRPFIEFRTKKARDNYPFTISHDVEFEVKPIPHKSVDILDNFGIVSYNLMNFKRINILKIVKAMESMGFGIIHNGGIIKSLDDSSCVPSDRFHIRLPYTDDPVWEYV